MLKQSPSVWLWLIAAFLSFVVSVYLWFMVDRVQGMFVGLWVPSILSLGVLLKSLRDETFVESREVIRHD